ncbi:MAG: sulfite exporter TauE/SafE family protein [Prevotella sp.]|nr:sulfite exporter TauE/SafE family protein [Prevotella sp.]
METTTIYLILLCIGASFIQRTTGFGFGIFIMSMLIHIMPSYGEAVTLSGMLALTTSFTIAIRLSRKVTWRRLLPMLVTFIIVSSICIFFLRRIEDVLLRQILGVVLILTSIYFAFVSKHITIKPTPKAQVGTGILSGLMGGFFGMQGPPAVLYYISSEPDKEHYMAMTQAYFVLGNAMMTVVRAHNGFLTSTVITSFFYGLIGVIIGTLLGAYVFNRIPSRLFRYVVYTYIGISGIIILLTA